jgi:hypothetical protein
MDTNTARRDHRAEAGWEIRPVGPADADDLKQLFHRLHLYNAGLDTRFALAEGWERHVEDLAEHASAALPPVLRPAAAVMVRRPGHTHPQGRALRPA